MKKKLLSVLVICLVLSRINIINVCSEETENVNFLETTDNFDNSDVTPQSNGIKYFIRLMAEGVLTTFIITVTGIDQLAQGVRDWVKVNLPNVLNYTYTYTEDNGCWSPEFPANPFCP